MRTRRINLLLACTMLIALGAGCYEDTILQTQDQDSFDGPIIVSSTNEGSLPDGDVRGEEDAVGSDQLNIENKDFDDDGVDEQNNPTTAGVAK